MATYPPNTVEPIEAVWLVNGTRQTGSAVVLFREFSTGSVRYWTGTTWTTTITALSMTDTGSEHLYLLTIPSSWEDMSVQVTCSLSGQPELSDEILVQTPSSGSAGSTYGGRLS